MLWINVTIVTILTLTLKPLETFFLTSNQITFQDTFQVSCWSSLTCSMGDNQSCQLHKHSSHLTCSSRINYYVFEIKVAFYDEEREIMALCNNPWITALQYAFHDIHNLYLVMEYHPGGDLLSLLSKYDDVLEEDVARFYLAEMVVAIHSLHVLGYVHRYSTF